MDPGLRREPGVIGVADRATGAREKYRAGAEALAIDLDTGGDRPSALRALDHHHSHVTLLPQYSFQIEPAGWDHCLLSVRGYLGASRTCRCYEHLGGLMLVAGPSPTGR